MPKYIRSHTKLGKHGRGTKGAAPASDAATCKGHCCLRVGAASSFFFFHNSRQLAPMRRRLRPICTKLGCFAPYRSISGKTTDTSPELADSGWNLRKKKQKNTKGVKRTVWTKTLYLSPQFSLSQFLSSALSHSLVFMLHATAFWPLLSVSPLSFSPLSQNLTLKSLNSQHTHTLLSVSPQVSISSFQS